MQTFNAVNYRGTIVRSFNDEKMARVWVKDHTGNHEGLHLRRLRMIEEVVYTPNASRPALTGPFAIPARPALVAVS